MLGSPHSRLAGFIERHLGLSAKYSGLRYISPRTSGRKESNTIKHTPLPTNKGQQLALSQFVGLKLFPATTQFELSHTAEYI